MGLYRGIWVHMYVYIHAYIYIYMYVYTYMLMYKVLNICLCHVMSSNWMITILDMMPFHDMSWVWTHPHILYDLLSHDVHVV